MASTEINQFPSSSLAEELLAIAEQFSRDIGALDFDEAILATARVLKDQGYHPNVMAKTIEHRGGLIGCSALIIDGDYNSPIGLDGARTWDTIRKDILRNKGYGRGKFLGNGQEIVFTSDNEFLAGNQEALISQIAARLSSHLEAQQMTSNTAHPSAVAAASAPRF